MCASVFCGSMTLLQLYSFSHAKMISLATFVITPLSYAHQAQLTLIRGYCETTSLC